MADPPDLLDPVREHQARVEHAIDSVRAKLGDGAIRKGRHLALEQTTDGDRRSDAAPKARRPNRKGPADRLSS